MGFNLKKPLWSYIKTCLYAVIGLAMLAQIVMSVIWMAGSVNAVPGFGDTAEYVALSDSFMLDEYRPVLYPLLLRIARNISEDHYFHYIYALQTGLCLACMVYAVYTIDCIRNAGREVKWRAANRLLWVFGGLYLTSIPMITFFNFTVLTDSIANSLLVLFLSVCIQVIYRGRLSIGYGVTLALSLIGQCLIRADRMYSGILLLLILAIMALIRNPRKRRAILLGTACIVAVTLGVVGVVSSATQVRGRNGRVQTGLSFILLDRVVWPHMLENYKYFPQEIRENITLEEAATFDSHNNNVMYQLAPALEARVGREKAEEYYRTMAQIVWKHSSKAIMKDIGETTRYVLVTPLMHYMSVKGYYNKTNIGWNMHCLSSGMPEFTTFYDENAFYLLVAALAVTLIIAVGNRIRRIGRGTPLLLWPYIIESVIICLWFTLGDGAPANDRYMLIIYVTYAIIPLMQFYRDAQNGILPDAAMSAEANQIQEKTNAIDSQGVQEA